MTAKRHVDYVRDYATNLIPVIPNDATLSPNSTIDPGNRGKVPGQRKADGTWFGGWKDLPPATMALAKLWDEWGAYIGGRTGIDGVIGLDVDLTVRKDADRVLALAYGIFGRTLAVRRVDHPEHTKLLICLRLEGPMPASFNIDILQSDGTHGQIQFLGPGRYFNLHGIHPKRLKPYIWENDPADVPLVSINLAEFEAFWAAIGKDFEVIHRPRLYAFNQVQRAPEQCTPEEMEALLELIPNDESFEPYGEFIEMGAAMFGASSRRGMGPGAMARLVRPGRPAPGPQARDFLGLDAPCPAAGPASCACSPTSAPPTKWRSEPSQSPRSSRRSLSRPAKRWTPGGRFWKAGRWLAAKPSTRYRPSDRRRGRRST